MRFLNQSTTKTKRSSSCLLGGVLACVCAVTAQAQSDQRFSATHVPGLAIASGAPAPGCPTNVAAKYIPAAALRPADPGAQGQSRKPMQLSFGTVAQSVGGAITAVQVRVRGISEKGGVILVGRAGAGSVHLDRSFPMNVAVNPAGLQSGTIWLAGYGGVSEVLLDSVTYANGRTWKPEANQSCRARMETMLTAAR